MRALIKQRHITWQACMRKLVQLSRISGTSVRIISSLITVIILLFPYFLKLSFGNFFIFLIVSLIFFYFLSKIKNRAASNSYQISKFAQKTTNLAQALSNVHLEYIMNGAPISSILQYYNCQKNYRLNQFNNELLNLFPRTLLEIIMIQLEIRSLTFNWV